MSADCKFSVKNITIFALGISDNRKIPHMGQNDEKFSPAFFKRRRSWGRVALIAARRRRDPLMALSFCQAFSLRLLHQRKSGLRFYATLQSLYLLPTTSDPERKSARDLTVWVLGRKSIVISFRRFPIPDKPTGKNQASCWWYVLLT